MNANKELSSEQIKSLFTRAASVGVAPEIKPMLRAAQAPKETPQRWRLSLVVGAVVMTAALLLLSPWKLDPVLDIPLQPVPSSVNPAAGLAPAPASKAELLARAEAAAKRKDWMTAGELATQAEDTQAAERYFDEGRAAFLLASCQEAVDKNKPSDAYRYCYEGPKGYEERCKGPVDKPYPNMHVYCYEAVENVYQTETYKDSTKLFDNGRAFYKASTLKEVKALLDEVEAIKKIKITDAKLLDKAKTQVSTAQERLDDINKCCGSDREVAKLEARASALSISMKTPNALCDEKACAASGGRCDAKTLLCETAPSKSKADATDEIKTTLALADGCSQVSRLLTEYRKAYGTSADYYYYKAYCFRDSNPEKACTDYVSFLKAEKAGPRASLAKSYIQSQEPAAYPTCVLP